MDNLDGFLATVKILFLMAADTVILEMIRGLPDLE
jgi:hypothetical protein